MIKTIYFERGTQLDKRLGSKYRFESIKVGAEATTFKEAQKEVEKNIAEYIAELKDKEANAEQERKSQAGTGSFEIDDRGSKILKEFNKEFKLNK